ncbi:phosphotransferase enzyme family protein [Paenibacillus prosopidis]|uniref:Phosphotransferase family enzyme n=1 Tax=Paenibacillus prosopidis TaxID=630520 RepID=A0A368VNH9_9BACL|nr:phosphotransferase [Paenibacillus prosopidis]RCW40641.1 phosphotransferase family enzyme [Paenibacillus prosopidis]
MEDWNPQLIQNWGKITGEIHQLTRQYSPPLGSNSRPSGIVESNQLLNSINVLQEQDPYVVKQYYTVKKQIEELSKNNHYGLIHNDNHHGNFRVDREWKITLFDFDECAYFWFANELSIPLYDATMDKCRLEVSRNNPIRSEYIKEFFTSFIEGYSQKYTVDDGLLKQIPIFLKIRDITRYILMKDMFRDNEGLQQHLIELRKTIENELPFSEII